MIMTYFSANATVADPPCVLNGDPPCASRESQGVSRRESPLIVLVSLSFGRVHCLCLPCPCLLYSLSRVPTH